MRKKPLVQKESQKKRMNKRVKQINQAMDDAIDYAYGLDAKGIRTALLHSGNHFDVVDVWELLDRVLTSCKNDSRTDDANKYHKLQVECTQAIYDSTSNQHIWSTDLLLERVMREDYRDSDYALINFCYRKCVENGGAVHPKIRARLHQTANGEYIPKGDDWQGSDSEDED